LEIDHDKASKLNPFPKQSCRQRGCTNNLLKSVKAYAKLAATLGGAFISENKSLFTISRAVKSNASMARLRQQHLAL